MSTAPAPVCPEGRNLLEGRVVAVTAAAGTGIGYATALRCAQEGATVVLSDRHERRLHEAGESLAAATGAEPLTVPCDVRRQSDVDSLFDAIAERHGRLDVLVNNAGLGGTADLDVMTDEQWYDVLEVTLTGTFRCMRGALRLMKPRGRGVILNNASASAWRAQPGQGHYAAAKAGVMALTRVAAAEAAPFGIRVNAVAPSLVLHPNLVKVTTQDLLDQLVGREAFGRSAEAWEVANVFVFLASDYSSYMTGEVVSVSEQRA
jgi:3-oxoacyl-[acyl-carrier protein] reductase